MKRKFVTIEELEDLCVLCYNAGENNGMKIALKRDDVISAKDYFDTRIVYIAEIVEL